MVKTSQTVAVSIGNGHAKAANLIAKHMGWSRSEVYDRAISEFIESIRKKGRDFPELKRVNLDPEMIGEMVVEIENGITKLKEELPSQVVRQLKQSFQEELKDLSKRLDIVEKNWGLRK